MRTGTHTPKKQNPVIAYTRPGLAPPSPSRVTRRASPVVDRRDVVAVRDERASGRGASGDRERCGTGDDDVDGTRDDDDGGGVSWTTVVCVGERTGCGVECVVGVVVDVDVVDDVCGVGAWADDDDDDDDARSSGVGVGVGVGREDAGAGRCGRRRCDCVFA